jgi:hypothetical protein
VVNAFVLVKWNSKSFAGNALCVVSPVHLRLLQKNDSAKDRWQNLERDLLLRLNVNEIRVRMIPGDRFSSLTWKSAVR